MRKRHDRYTWTLIFLGSLSLGAASEPSGAKLMSVSLANLCVTEGAIDLSVSVPKMRAYLNAFTPNRSLARSGVSSERSSTIRFRQFLESYEKRAWVRG